MNFIEFFLSKHFWRWLWMEFCALFYKRVDAKTLMDICECFNPPRTHRDFDAWSSNNDSSPVEEEKLASMIEAAGLREHILLSDEGNGKAIKFVNLKIKGDVNLNLSGTLNRWEFHRIKFDGIGISVFPPLNYWNIGVVVFNKIISRYSFGCMYAGVSDIRICDSVLPSVSMKIGVPNRSAAYGRMENMMRSFFRDSIAPAVEFSGNCIKDLAPYTELTLTDPNETLDESKRVFNLGSVSFVKGNYIGVLRLLTSMLPYDESARDDRKVRTFFPGDEVVSVARIHFDPHERIAMPSDWEEKMKYKEYFVALKNQAIRRHDREAEFSHGRKERYFDRGLANRWQDKFILGWSHYVSDSGISWIRPIGWLIAVQAILAVAFIGWNVWICPSDWSVGGWAKTVIESFDPLSKVESKCADSLSAPFYNVARKIFLFLFLYEIIKVFRRFSK